MNFALKPTLEQIALAKVVVILWNQNDVRALLKNYSYPEFSCDRKEEWQKMEDKVSEKVKQLSQPEPLIKKMLAITRPIGLEILKWMQRHLKDNEFGLHLPSEFFFTSYGSVDLQKTAEILIKDEDLPLEARYRLACMYCFKDYVLELWYKLPEDSKQKFYSKEAPNRSEEHLFVTFFTYTIKGELSKLDYISENKYSGGLYVYLFKKAAVDSNKVATEYFFNKLISIEKDTYLVNVAKKVSEIVGVPYSIDVFLFLLCQMNQEQQISVFNKKPYEKLLCMLDWPWQDLFLDTIIFMDNYIPHSFYENALQKIIQKVMDGFKDCYYQIMFSELWVLIPDENRYYIINQCFRGSLLSNLNQCFSGGLLANLFQIKDKVNIKLVLEDATPQLKKEFIFKKNQGLLICQRLINEGDLDLLEFFIQSCITTKDEIVRFREVFDESPTWIVNSDSNWYNFFCFIDKLIYRYDKRKSDEEMNSIPVKKLCTMK